MNKTLSVNPKRELPLQHDLQATQFADRLLKDHQRVETFRHAYHRLRLNIDQMREEKLQERDRFYAKLEAMRREEDIKRHLKQQAL